MSFTSCEIAKLAITFPKENADQIKAKAARYRVQPADVGQGLSLIILEKCKDFDAAKGTFAQFIFGHWEKQMRGQLGAHTFAISLDSDDPLAEGARILVGTQIAPGQEESGEAASVNPPHMAEMLEIARFISGKSCSEIARSFGVTPRYVRRSLQKLRETRVIPHLFKDVRQGEPLSPADPRPGFSERHLKMRTKVTGSTFSHIALTASGI